MTMSLERVITVTVDGYPTDRFLNGLSKSDAKQDHKDMLEAVRAIWAYPEFVTVEGDTYTFRTGGWSGNESLISALQQNTLFWNFCWEMSQRGGLHVFTAKQLPTR
jgi:hypothetical protein